MGWKRAADREPACRLVRFDATDDVVHSADLARLVRAVLAGPIPDPVRLFAWTRLDAKRSASIA